MMADEVAEGVELLKSMEIAWLADLDALAERLASIRRFVSGALADVKIASAIPEVADEYDLDNAVGSLTNAHIELGMFSDALSDMARRAVPSEQTEPVGWQRRLMNTRVEVGGVPAGTWGPWSECTLEQAVYARRWGGVEGFPDYLKAEARPVYALLPPSQLGEMGEPVAWRAEITLLIQDLTWCDIGGKRYVRKGGIGEDGLREVINRLERLAAAPIDRPGADRAGWQPIETAPKDGTCIYLAWNSEDWTFGEGMWRGDGWVASAAFHNPDLPHPRMEFREYRPNNPLLWQPLPASPTGGQP